MQGSADLQVIGWCTGEGWELRSRDRTAVLVRVTDLHSRAGNVAFGDGSVGNTWPAKLLELISHQEVAANRLLVP